MGAARRAAVSRLQRTWIASGSSWRRGRRRRRRGPLCWRHSVGEVKGGLGVGGGWQMVAVANRGSVMSTTGLGCEADVVVVVELGAELLVDLAAVVVVLVVGEALRYRGLENAACLSGGTPERVPSRVASSPPSTSLHPTTISTYDIRWKITRHQEPDHTFLTPISNLATTNTPQPRSP